MNLTRCHPRRQHCSIIPSGLEGWLKKLGLSRFPLLPGACLPDEVFGGIDFNGSRSLYGLYFRGRFDEAFFFYRDFPIYAREQLKR